MPSANWSWSTRAQFLLLVIVWGFNYPFVGLGLAYAGSLWLATFRAGLGAIGAFAIVAAGVGFRSLDRRGRRDAMLLGLPNTSIFFGLWFLAARSIPPGVVAVLVYTFPLWVALVSPPLLGHRLTNQHWVAIAIGFGGVVLIAEAWSIVGSGVSWIAVVEALAGAISWALGTVLFQRRFHPSEMPEANAFQLLGGTAGLVVGTLVFGFSPVPAPSWPLLLTALWLGILGTAVSYGVWYSLLGRTRAATLSAYVFLVPVVALVSSALIFGERLAPIQLLGVALVLASIYGIGTAAGAGDPPPHPPGRPVPVR